MDPAGRDELLELAQDLTRNKGMSLLFSSHLLRDAEAVCDFVIVLGQGRLLARGPIEELKKKHERLYELRVKQNQEQFAQRLEKAGCRTELLDEHLVVEVPVAETAGFLWRLASESGHQIRHLRPRRSTLEEAFLQAVDEAN